MEMIREVDPNRGITLMAPGYAADGVKTLAQEYGGEFHDTGFMAGVWADLLPCLMRGSDLPFSLEPGGPAPDAAGFKRMMGLYQSEGIQEVSYFIHIGDVMWHPDIRAEFEKQLPMIHMIGKYHVTPPDVAFLWSTEDGALTGFPWSNDRNSNLPSGWNWRGPFEGMLNYCQRDAISESDFEHGYAAKYKVIIDTNTSIMDQAMLDQIEKYVRDGGTFITLIHTGRHSPTQFDSWPIEKLTGYHVLTIEKYNATGGGIHFDDMNAPGAGSNTQLVFPAPGQEIYKQQDDWMKTPWITGLRMKKVADDAQDLLVWKDGTVAVGMRKIGKGAIIEFGAIVGQRRRDRAELVQANPGLSGREDQHHVGAGSGQARRPQSWRLFSPRIRQQQRPLPCHLALESGQCAAESDRDLQGKAGERVRRRDANETTGHRRQIGCVAGTVADKIVSDAAQ